jgi:hypothetical protein
MKVYEIIKEEEIPSFFKAVLKESTLIELGLPPSPWTKFLTRVSTKVKRDKRKLDKYEEFYNRKYGTPLKLLFRTVGITASVIELYATLGEIDDIYAKQTPIPREDGTITPISQEGYTQLRELAYGTFQIQVLVPFVVPWIARVAKTLLLVNWIKRIGAIASAPVTAGLSVGAMLATEAGTLAFQTWLGSEAGKQWILNSIFMEPIRAFGKFGENAADGISLMLSGKTNLEKADEKKDKIQGTDTSQAAQTTGKEAPAPASDYKDNSVRFVKGNTVYVGGVPVTDADGFLIPSALDNLGVISARYRAQRRGLKDPLSGIPQKPGTTPITMDEPDKEEIPAGGDRRGSTKDAQAAWEKNKQPLK